ncbi:response regulator receiver domain protein [Bacteriovorax sp. DB6_IX]|nr:response regulator receiver domain protein [Bacteriovorax sp. DB6_IX]
MLILSLMTKRILYVEDEREFVELVAQEFNTKNYTYIHSAKLSEAAAKARNQKFDVIVTDIKLESGTGDQLIKTIKSNPQHMNYKTPVIVSSAYLTSDIIKSLHDKINKVLVKPHYASDIVTAIDSL